MEIRKYVSVLPPFDIVEAVQFNGDMYELAVLIPDVELLSGTDGIATIRISDCTMKVYDGDYIAMGKNGTFALDSEMFSILYEKGGEE